MHNHNILILGGTGSVGKSFIKILNKKNLKYHAPTSKQLNLLSKISVKKFFYKTKVYKTVVFISAITPDKGKDLKTLNKNSSMLINSINFFKFSDHFIYISSDAIFNTSAEKIKKNTMPDPDSYHGLMHLFREKIIKTELDDKKTTILRSTLLFGKEDMHSGYGPNRFIKSAIMNKEITIFGKGEDKRDHLPLSILGLIIFKVYQKKIIGTYEVASGQSFSFKYIAKLIQKKLDKKTQISYIKNNNKPTFRYFKYLPIYKKLNINFKLNIEKEINDLIKLKSINEKNR